MVTKKTKPINYSILSSIDFLKNGKRQNKNLLGKQPVVMILLLFGNIYITIVLKCLLLFDTF